MAVPEPPGSADPIDPDEIASTDGFLAALAELRVRAGLTVRELGRAADIPGSTIGGYLSGRHLPPPTRPEVLGRLLTALGVPEADHPAWVRMLWRVHAWRLPKAVSDRRPFLGLLPFSVEDHDVFFGRSQDAARLIDLVTSGGSGLVAVVGASGSGKTSLIRAGLLAGLPDSWRVGILTPGADPEAAISSTVGLLLEPGPSTGPAPARLLVVDQLEELWTLTQDGDVRARALAALGAFAAADGARCVVGLRSDFYAAAAQGELLLAALRGRQFLVGPMSEAEMASTITGPAAAFDIELTPGLVEQMVSDARAGMTDRSAVLPHLSQALSMMWQASPRRALTIEDYHAVGRIAGAVARSAEQAWAGLPADLHGVARQLLLRLVVVDEGLPPSAGVMSLADITTDQQRAVVDHFARRRLVVVSEETVRFAHETVLSAWGDLALWIEADRDRLQLSRVVTREARGWDASGRDPDLLLRGSRLAGVREWPDDPRHPTTVLEAAFISVSAASTDAQRDHEEQTYRRTRRLLAAVSVLAVAALVTAAGLVSSRIAIATERDQALSRQIAADARNEAGTDPAVSRQLAVAAYQTSPTVQARSMLLGSTAEPSVTDLNGPVGPRMLAAAPSRKLLVAAGTMSTVRIYDTSGTVPRLLSEPAAPVDDTAGASIYAVAFSPDARLLVLAGSAGRVRVLDVADPAAPTPVGTDLVLPADPTNGNHTAYTASFSPDGRDLLVGTAAAGVARWRLPTPTDPAITELPRIAATGYVTALAVTADGSVVTGTSTGQVALWSPSHPNKALSTVNLDQGYVAWIAAYGTDLFVATRTQKTAYRISLPGSALGTPTSLGTFTGWVNWVAPLPERNLLAFGSSDHNVRIMTPAGQVVDQFAMPEAVTSLADLGSHRLAIGLVDGRTIVRTNPLQPADGPNTSIFFARWSGDSRRMAVFPSGTSTEVRLWDTSTPLAPKPLAVLRDTSAGGLANGSGDISRDGNHVVAGTYTGYLVGWDVTNPAAPKVVFATKVADANVEQVSFAGPSRLVLACDDKTIRVISLPPGGTPTVTATLTGASDIVLNSATSPDGTLVAGASQDGSARLYRTGTGQISPVATIPQGGYAYAVAFTPDGHHLAVAGASKQVRIYNITTLTAPQLTNTLSGPTGTIYLLDITNDGRIAAASLDGTVTIWQPTDGGYHLQASLPGTTSLFGVSWSPDGQHLAAVGQSSRLSLWATDPAQARTAICNAIGDPLTKAQWVAILPDQPYTPPCQAP